MEDNFAKKRDITLDREVEFLQGYPLVRRDVGILDMYSEGQALGKGAFGAVYQVRQKDTGAEFACKTITKQGSSSLHELNWRIAQVKQEAFVHTDPAMAHKNILPVLQVFEDTQSVHMVMDLCREDLMQHLGSKKSLSEFDLAKAFKCMASGLENCHSCGVMHGDVKLENTWMKGEDPVLGDFGLARCFTAGHRFKTKAGTLAYMAPEVLKGNYTVRADLWSLGVALYIMLSGTKPFAGPNIEADILAGRFAMPSASWKNITKDAKDIVKALLRVKPDARITLQQLLQCPWLQGKASKKPVLGLPSRLITLREGKNHANRMYRLAQLIGPTEAPLLPQAQALQAMAMPAVLIPPAHDQALVPLPPSAPQLPLPVTGPAPPAAGLPPPATGLAPPAPGLRPSAPADLQTPSRKKPRTAKQPAALLSVASVGSLRLLEARVPVPNTSGGSMFQPALSGGASGWFLPQKAGPQGWTMPVCTPPTHWPAPEYTEQAQEQGHSMPHALSWKPAEIMTPLATPATIFQQPGTAGSEVSSIPSVFQENGPSPTQSMAKLSFHEVQAPLQQSSLAAAGLPSAQAGLHHALPMADNSIKPALKQRCPLQELTWVPNNCPNKQAFPAHWSAGFCLRCGPQVTPQWRRGLRGTENYGNRFCNACRVAIGRVWERAGR